MLVGRLGTSSIGLLPWRARFSSQCGAVGTKSRRSAISLCRVPSGSHLRLSQHALSTKSSGANPFEKRALKELPHTDKHFFDLKGLGDPRFDILPFSIRVLLESAVRNCDQHSIKERDVEAILAWKKSSRLQTEIPFMPARVLLQDFTGVPACVDLAAMRDAVLRLGGDPESINPLVPVDLVVDHSIQVDYSRSSAASEKNQDLEISRNRERFAFLKWAAKSFDNLRIVPPGSGIVHQVNLEFLARCVFDSGPVVYPDSLVGTDSHTTMIDGLGVVGWGVGGIEAEAVMLGQPISMILPEVTGFELTGRLHSQATATDLVLTCTELLRNRGVVGKFVEFFGSGTATLPVADRATIANMAPEYGATMGFFPVDARTLQYLRQTGRPESKVALLEKYLRAAGLFNTGVEQEKIEFSDVMHLDLATVEPCLAGPKRPQDRVLLKDMSKDFKLCLSAPRGFKGFGLPEDASAKSFSFKYQSKEYDIRHGSVVIASITSCTNTSNPGVMLGAGLLAKKAVERGLIVRPYIKTSLSPGSKAVTEYFALSGLTPYFEKLGFYHAGYGCMTCIGNSGDLDPEVAETIGKHDIVAAAVLSGNRNFEGRTHPLTHANYLASPPLVVAYALAGRMDIDFEKESLGTDNNGNEVFLRDVWPTAQEISELEDKYIKGTMFTNIYKNIKEGGPQWNALPVFEGKVYPWEDASTYIHNPPFFKDITRVPVPMANIESARCLLLLGHSVTTDHISPAGNIASDSPAGRYLKSRGISKTDFNTYGARRGNDEVMTRGTFANIRLINKMCPGAGQPSHRLIVSSAHAL
eukprot:GHVT01076018.1.p1 GENE.GHVT01076018.1~~GHVT01076018.1.p1  ORF type:complete len:810 (-),score=57.84 GHVT01076018.1:1470-3899(-)